MEPGHLTAWDVADFIEGELEPGELLPVCRHLSRCPECVQWVAAVIAADVSLLRFGGQVDYAIRFASKSLCSNSMGLTFPRVEWRRLGL